MNISINRLVILWAIMAIVYAVISCDKPGKQASLPDSSKPADLAFNPYYFKNDRIVNFAVKVKFRDGNYQLAENKIYRLPGRPKKKLNKPDGIFQLIYLDKNNIEIGRYKTFSPREVLVDKFNSLAIGFTSSSVKLLPETDFFIPLHPSGLTHSIRIMEKGLVQAVTLVLPSDTLNVAVQNKKLL